MLDAGYSYAGLDVEWSVVCLSACLCALVTRLSFAKTAEQRNAVYGEGKGDSCRPKEPCIVVGAQWRHLANIIERCVLGGGADRQYR